MAMLNERVTFDKDMRPDGGFALEQLLPQKVRHRLDRIEVPKVCADVIAQAGEEEAKEVSFFLFQVCLLAACLQADGVQISRSTFSVIYLISHWSALEPYIADAILTDNDCIKDKGVFDYE